MGRFEDIRSSILIHRCCTHASMCYIQHQPISSTNVLSDRLLVVNMAGNCIVAEPIGGLVGAHGNHSVNAAQLTWAQLWVQRGLVRLIGR